MSIPIKWSIWCFVAIVLVLLIGIGGLYLLAMHSPTQYRPLGAIVKDLGGKQRRAEFSLSVAGSEAQGYVFEISPGTSEDLAAFRQRDAAFRIQLFDRDGGRIKELVILGRELKQGNDRDNPGLYLSGGFTHNDGPPLIAIVGRWNAVYEEGP
jgi:hypothetical protein